MLITLLLHWELKGESSFTFDDNAISPLLFFLPLWSSSNIKLDLGLNSNTLKSPWNKTGYKNLVTQFFQVVDVRVKPTANTANNKTLPTSAGIVRWTLSFCIVIYLMKLFDSLVLEDCYEPESVDYATWRKFWCNKRWMSSNTMVLLIGQRPLLHRCSTL